MHELCLAANILQMVEDAARRESFARVRRLHLEAGSLSGVDVAALRFALECVAPDTLLAGAAIIIDEPAGEAWCMTCAKPVALHARGEACPDCAGYELIPQTGTALRVIDLDVAD